MLAVVALFLAALRHVAADIPRDTNYVIRSIASCPNEGYFFKREAILNGVDQGCLLCFCQDDSTAVCWRRDNRRCDMKHYFSIGQRSTRERRSPLSLGEISIRDAAKEFLNKQSPEQCKAHESSFSKGCPPADWCTGCTVCDCDANGRWDCHILSFCPDKNGKKEIKKRHGPLKNGISKRQSKTSATNAMTRATKKPSRKARKPLQKQNVRRNQLKPNVSVNKHKIDPVKGTKLKKFARVNKPKANLQSKKATTKNNGKPLAIRKSILNGSRYSIKPSKYRKHDNKTLDAVKEFVTAMQKMMKRNDINSSKQGNKVFKRSTPKQNVSKKARADKHRPRVIAKATSIAKATKIGKGNRTTLKPQQLKLNKTGRIKRQVNAAEHNLEMSSLNFNGTTENAPLSSKLPKEMEGTDVYNLLNNTHTTQFYPEHNFTANAISLKKNKDIYITDNKVYEDSNSHAIFYYNVDNLTTLHYFTSDITLSPTWSFGNDITTQKNTGTAILPNSPNLYPNMRNYNETESNLKENQEIEIVMTNKTKPMNLKVEKNDNSYFIKEKIHVKNTTSYNYGLRSLFHRLLSENEIDSKSIKPKRFTILTKIKRLFRKLFHRTSKNNFYSNKDVNSHDDNSFQSTHIKLGPEINKLRQKMESLRNESVNILKTLRTIKGLLKILELKTNKTRNKIDSNGSLENFNKLNIILNEKFSKEEIAQNLTNDQRTQINQIKVNVKFFIESIERFATILDEVVQIVMHYNRNQNKTINTTMRIYSSYKSNEEYKVVRIKQKIKKLKELMMKYNVLQNKFTHQVYSILNSLETSVPSNKYKVQYNPVQFNKTDAIETNSANIIRNIRRLKILADKLKSRNRRKRETIGDEDALGYVLLLMEYLLRRHVPLNPPVNDGIDILIEAIKKAPDVKPIEKKVLEHSTSKITLVTRTARPTIYKGISTSRITSKEDSNENALNQVDENRAKTLSTSQSDDDESDEDIDEAYQKFKSVNDSRSEQKDVLSDFGKVTTKSYYKIKEEDYFSENGSNSRRFEPVNLTEEVPTTIYSNLALESETSNEYSTTFTINDINTIAPYLEKSASTENKLLVDAKANIDWIAENFGDAKRMRDLEINFSTPKTLHATRTIKTRPKVPDNLSDISNEIISKKERPSAEEVVSKKEMDLLNSLDYTGRDAEEETDSKDVRLSEPS